jgi:glutathione synthase/RimK-type ligase-like ATP-grasp enzyme
MYYSGSKVSQTLVFLEENVDFIPTYYANDSRVLTAYVANKVGYPYILKANNGTQGNSNYLVQSVEDAERILAGEPDIDFIAQDYCRNDRDYRLLMVGPAKLVFERRGQAGSHLNNTSKGGSAQPVPEDALQAHIVPQAQAIASRLGLVVAGFDVVPELETGKQYFLEVNSQPQLRTGMLLEQKQALVRELFREL